MERSSCGTIQKETLTHDEFLAKISSEFNLIDNTIRDGWINTQILSSRMNRIANLKREVELQEKAAEEAKQEAAKGGFDILQKAEALKQEQQIVKEANDMIAREVNADMVVLDEELKELHLLASGLLNEESRSLILSDVMHRVLKMRQTKATREKELADKEKLEKEKLALETLAFEETQMLKLVEESRRLKKQALINSRLQVLVNERVFSINNLQGDMSNIHQDSNLFLEFLDQPVMSSSQTSTDSDLEEQEENVNADITEVGHSVSSAAGEIHSG